VLEKLTKRITQDSTHSVMQMPNSPLGDQYAANVGKDAAARMDQIKAVKQQLENWQQELKELRRLYVSNRI
jgi:ubiquinone biosynthesis protein UbiJ